MRVDKSRRRADEQKTLDRRFNSKHKESITVASILPSVQFVDPSVLPSVDPSILPID
ncbi:hypothetical protein NC653_037434 [Populus alba x Populus x berolinensis]|uniref:Uncharacterized protein n=1 Tax=Populus alba x Populus x berolinensis TaxID=444605 RepID=A0AAD6LG00_9ROSI|nr:hypothetical protein NC653_037434 [Populus alba x Populus x berolinensis]